MKNANNLDLINHSFEIQANEFENKSLNFTNESYLNKIISQISPNKSMTVLDVAAGTCAVSRSFAPLANMVVCLDATAAMLKIGREKAEKSEYRNMVFVKGSAEELPFLSDSFELVISRLAFHHFSDVNTVFSEMTRVCKPGGRVVIIDMEAAENGLRDIRDEIETLRDPSHVKNLSKNELLALFREMSITVETVEITEMPTELSSWMKLTDTPNKIKEYIRELMEIELNGGAKTGFSPYHLDNKIYFNHQWVMIVGRKR